jgi:hypothetical protein
MKTTILAIVALLAGIGVGLAGTWWEFAGNRLPTESFTSAATSITPAHLGKEGPRATVEGGETFNFGKMDRYGAQSHVFMIRNDGDSELTLIKGETTCKCTQFELAPDRLAPGESAKVTLTWEAKTNEPEFQQSAEITTNDPRHDKIRLVVMGRVIDAVRPERFDLVASTLSANEDAELRLKLFTYEGDKLEIQDAKLKNPESADHFKIHFEPLSPGEIAKERDATAGQEMVVELKSGLPLGPINQTIMLSTGNPALPTLDIPVVGRIVSDISLAGPKLDPDLSLLTLGTVDRDIGTRATIYLIVKGPHRDETELRVKSLDPAGSLQATITPPQDDNAKIKRFALTVSVPPGTPPVSRLASGKLGKIVIETTNPLVKEIVVHVRFAVKE